MSDEPEKKEIEVVEETTKVVEEVTPKAKVRRKTAVQAATENIRNEIVYDVVVPRGKSFLYDIGEGLLDILSSIMKTAIFGDDREAPRHVRNDRRGRPYQDYTRSSITYRERRGRERPPWEGGRNLSRRSSPQFDDIYFDDKRDAIEVLDDLIDDTLQYGMVSVDAFYTHPLVRVDTHNYNDRRWGWEDLSNATVARTADGWILDLPNPHRLDID